MNKEELNLFFTDVYKVLRCIANPAIMVNDDYYSITQKEIANSLYFNIMKVNNIMKILTDNGYIKTCSGCRGRYLLSDKAKHFLAKIKDLEETE